LLHLLRANPTASKRCDELRLAMEASERKRDSTNTDLRFNSAEPDPEYSRTR
jgi:hypothetical protein